MDHDEALERIDIAAAEPDGIDRLMAGDTRDAAAVAGHLAGCPSCAAELVRIRRTAGLVRDVVREEPDPALRARTLAYVREVGRARGAQAAPEPVQVPHVVPLVVPAGSGRRWPRLVAGVGIAAALLLGAVLGYAGGSWTSPATPAPSDEIAVLQDATTAAMRVGAQADAVPVALVSTDGSTAAGSLLFSPSTGELVMTATGLAAAPAGSEYVCWIEMNGRRRRLGEMYPGGGIHAWSGVAVGLDQVPPGTTFGVSLAPSGGGEAQPVLTGMAD